MKNIEFLGIARSGKTTVAKYLKENFSNVKYYPERHDLVPKEIFDDHFEHNFWYANYCVDTINSIPKNQSINIFERGIIDRVVIGRVYFKMGWFTKEQFIKYEELLIPHVKKIDQVFVFLIPVETSVKRAEEMGKDVTKAISYMKSLYEEYKKLDKWVDNCVYLPEKAGVGELESAVAKKLGLIKKVPVV